MKPGDLVRFCDVDGVFELEEFGVGLIVEELETTSIDYPNRMFEVIFSTTVMHAFEYELEMVEEK